MNMRSQYEVTTLSNGVRIATAWMPHLRGVCAGIWAAVGGRHERPSECGLAHFLEHLLFKGTSAHTARELTLAVEGVGGYINAFTTEDHTCYYAKADAAYFERLGEVLCEMYLDAQFPETELEREREVIREEILSLSDSPAQWAEDLLSSCLWPEHPLGNPLTGTLESVAQLKRSHLLAFRKRHYVGRNTIFTVAGPVLHEDVLAMVRGPLEKLPRGRPSQMRIANGPRTGVRVAEEDTGQAHLALGFRACSRTDPRRFALKLGSVLLGENMSSRLFQNLRESKGFCYSVQSSTVALEETGALCIYTDLDVSKLTRAVKAIRKETAHLCARPPSRSELRLAQQYSIGQNRIALDSATQQNCWMAESLMAFGRLVEVEEVERAMLSVTAGQVQSAVSEWLNFESAAAALVGPGVKQAELERMVRS
ncbi:MAG: insulinase family protein [Chthoniobacterales bacterium]|nr:insulinase family protein [Chthoniobacterales bacterium]